jgi:MFS transporter, SP family, arabinose:H+ symporter
VWNSSIGLNWVLVCFAALCVMAIAFVFRFLPETKCLSVEEIVREFEREAQGSAQPPRQRPRSGRAVSAASAH